ncbi:hypothetical protein D5H75_20820 [Bailinhaonella thermotolerans]|uniref:DUF4367 domain-containing protein n=2 Tax=Bailinhaonella thermotolerans TaxID=1070861 RepID=A0A3A4ATX8_9ACTN|nr:hypothetical protein D5H75_20820 [Bailinhaonella thermotolerans]
MPDMPDLERELTALGAELDVPPPPPAPEVARAVRRRLQRPRGRRGFRPGWRPVTIGVALVTAILLGATPQGRAAVATVLRFAGVEIHVDPAPRPAPSPAPSPAASSPALPGERRVSLAEARARAPFRVLVPAALGAPDEVRLADGDRVVTLHWRARPGRPAVRLDEFAGRVEPVWRKDLGPPYPEEVRAGTRTALWIPRDHGLTYYPEGSQSPLTYERRAGPTLIWQHGGTGLRLEGLPTSGAATRIAATLR